LKRFTSGCSAFPLFAGRGKQAFPFPAARNPVSARRQPGRFKGPPLSQTGPEIIWPVYLVRFPIFLLLFFPDRLSKIGIVFAKDCGTGRKTEMEPVPRRNRKGENSM
jgi:hypothetical protein